MKQYFFWFCVPLLCWSCLCPALLILFIFLFSCSFFMLLLCWFLVCLYTAFYFEEVMWKINTSMNIYYSCNYWLWTETKVDFLSFLDPSIDAPDCVYASGGRLLCLCLFDSCLCKQYKTNDNLTWETTCLHL